jgi:DNA-binding Lrp family transcriptional regulator
MRGDELDDIEHKILRTVSRDDRISTAALSGSV